MFLPHIRAELVNAQSVGPTIPEVIAPELSRLTNAGDVLLPSSIETIESSIIAEAIGPAVAARTATPRLAIPRLHLLFALVMLCTAVAFGVLALFA